MSSIDTLREEANNKLLEMHEDEIPMGMTPDREYTVEELMSMNHWKQQWYHNFIIREHELTQ